MKQDLNKKAEYSSKNTFMSSLKYIFIMFIFIFIGFVSASSVSAGDIGDIYVERDGTDISIDPYPGFPTQALGYYFSTNGNEGWYSHDADRVSACDPDSLGSGYDVIMCLQEVYYDGYIDIVTSTISLPASSGTYYLYIDIGFDEMNGDLSGEGNGTFCYFDSDCSSTPHGVEMYYNGNNSGVAFYHAVYGPYVVDGGGSLSVTRDDNYIYINSSTEFPAQGLGYYVSTSGNEGIHTWGCGHHSSANDVLTCLYDEEVYYDGYVEIGETSIDLPSTPGTYYLYIDIGVMEYNGDLTGYGYGTFCYFDSDCSSSSQGIEVYYNDANSILTFYHEVYGPYVVSDDGPKLTIGTPTGGSITGSGTSTVYNAENNTEFNVFFTDAGGFGVTSKNMNYRWETSASMTGSPSYVSATGTTTSLVATLTTPATAGTYYLLILTFTDAGGNNYTSSRYHSQYDSGSYFFKFVITAADTTAPTISSVTGGSTTWAKTRTITVSATDSGGLHSSAYSFDGGSTWQSSNSKTFSSAATTLAANKIQVRDAAGNIKKYASAVNLYIDTSAPTLTIGTPSNGSITGSGSSTVYNSGVSKNVTLTFTDNAGFGVTSKKSYYQWSSPSTGVPSSLSEFTATGTADTSLSVTLTTPSSAGTYYLWVDSFADAAGNNYTSSTECDTIDVIHIFKFVITAADTTAPTINSVTGGSTTWAKTRTITVSATDSGGLHSSAYSFDGGSTWQASNSKTFSSAATTLAANKIQVRDAAGNVKKYASSVNLYIDTSAPTLAIGTPSNGYTTGNGNSTIYNGKTGETVTITFTDNNSLANYNDTNYYRYCWSTSISDTTCSTYTSITGTRTSKKVSGTITLPSTAGTHYLIIEGSAKDTAGWYMANSTNIGGIGNTYSTGRRFKFVIEAKTAITNVAQNGTNFTFTYSGVLSQNLILYGFGSGEYFSMPGGDYPGSFSEFLNEWYSVTPSNNSFSISLESSAYPDYVHYIHIITTMYVAGNEVVQFEEANSYATDPVFMTTDGIWVQFEFETFGPYDISKPTLTLGTPSNGSVSGSSSSTVYTATSGGTVTLTYADNKGFSSSIASSGNMAYWWCSAYTQGTSNTCTKQYGATVYLDVGTAGATSLSRSVTIPSVSSQGTYYLWVVSNLSDYSGNYMTSSTAYGTYVGSGRGLIFKFTLKPSDNVAPELEVGKPTDGSIVGSGTSTVYYAQSGKNVTLSFYDSCGFGATSKTGYYEWVTYSSDPKFSGPSFTATGTVNSLSATIKTPTTEGTYYLWIYPFYDESNNSYTTSTYHVSGNEEGKYQPFTNAPYSYGFKFVIDNTAPTLTVEKPTYGYIEGSDSNTIYNATAGDDLYLTYYDANGFSSSITSSGNMAYWWCSDYSNGRCTQDDYDDYDDTVYLDVGTTGAKSLSRYVTIPSVPSSGTYYLWVVSNLSDYAGNYMTSSTAYGTYVGSGRGLIFQFYINSVATITGVSQSGNDVTFTYSGSISQEAIAYIISETSEYPLSSDNYGGTFEDFMYYNFEFVNPVNNEFTITLPIADSSYTDYYIHLLMYDFVGPDTSSYVLQANFISPDAYTYYPTYMLGSSEYGEFYFELFGPYDTYPPQLTLGTPSGGSKAGSGASTVYTATSGATVSLTYADNKGFSSSIASSGNMAYWWCHGDGYTKGTSNVCTKQYGATVYLDVETDPDAISFSRSATVPSVTSTGTYYLWVVSNISDTSGNWLTSSTAYGKYVGSGRGLIFKFTLKPSDNVAPELEVGKPTDGSIVGSGTSTVYYAQSGKNVTLSFYDSCGFGATSKSGSYEWVTYSSDPKLSGTSFTATGTVNSLSATIKTPTTEGTYYLWIYPFYDEANNSYTTSTYHVSGNEEGKYQQFTNAPYYYGFKFVIDNTAPNVDIDFTYDEEGIPSGSYSQEYNTFNTRSNVDISVRFSDSNGLRYTTGSYENYRYCWSTTTSSSGCEVKNGSKWLTGSNGLLSAKTIYYNVVTPEIADGTSVTYYLIVEGLGRDYAGWYTNTQYTISSDDLRYSDEERVFEFIIDNSKPTIGLMPDEGHYEYDGNYGYFTYYANPDAHLYLEFNDDNGLIGYDWDESYSYCWTISLTEDAWCYDQRYWISISESRSENLIEEMIIVPSIASELASETYYLLVNANNADYAYNGFIVENIDGHDTSYIMEFDGFKCAIFKVILDNEAPTIEFSSISNIYYEETDDVFYVNKNFVLTVSDNIGFMDFTYCWLSSSTSYCSTNNIQHFEATNNSVSKNISIPSVDGTYYLILEDPLDYAGWHIYHEYQSVDDLGTDEGGNRVFKFVVDKTAPELSLSGSRGNAGDELSLTLIENNKKISYYEYYYALTPTNSLTNDLIDTNKKISSDGGKHVIASTYPNGEYYLHLFIKDTATNKYDKANNSFNFDSTYTDTDGIKYLVKTFKIQVISSENVTSPINPNMEYTKKDDSAIYLISANNVVVVTFEKVHDQASLSTLIQEKGIADKVVQMETIYIPGASSHICKASVVKDGVNLIIIIFVVINSPKLNQTSTSGSSMTINKGEEFNTMGLSFSSKNGDAVTVDTLITLDGVKVKSLDTNVVGVYSITHVAKDTFGRTTTVVREVVVKDNEEVVNEEINNELVEEVLPQVVVPVVNQNVNDTTTEVVNNEKIEINENNIELHIETKKEIKGYKKRKKVKGLKKESFTFKLFSKYFFKIYDG